MGNYKTAALLSYINITLNIVLGIFITPFIIKMLGDSEYGLYTLIGAFVGYLSILDLGLNNAIVRYVAQYQTQNNEKGQENFLAISLIIYVFIGLLIAIGGLIMYLNVNRLFGDSLSLSEISKAKTMLLILVGNIAISLPGGSFTGICSGYEHFVFPRVLSITKYVLRTIMVITILYFGADALGMVILDTVMNLLFILASMYYVFKILKVKIKLHRFKLTFIREIFGYSIWIFIFALVYQFQWRTGQIILGSTTNTTTVAVYGVGVLLGVYFMTFGNVINGLVLPKAVKAVYNKSSSIILTAEMLRLSRVTLILLMYVFGAFLLLGQEFILLWIGPTYIDSWLVAVLIMVAYIIPISQGYAHAILEAKKRMRFKSISSLVLSVLGIVLGGYLSKLYGIHGMIYGIFSALLVLQLMVAIFYHKKLSINMFTYLRSALIPFLLLLIGTTTISYLLFQWLVEGWVLFLLKGIIYSLFFCMGLWITLKEDEKLIITKYISRYNIY